MKGFCLSLLLLQGLFSNTLGSAANDLERPHTVSDGSGAVNKITLTPFDDKFKFLAQVRIVHLVVLRARTLMRTYANSHRYICHSILDHLILTRLQVYAENTTVRMTWQREDGLG